MNMPYVSVVIPVYNGERYIAEALESVLSQSYGRYEILVIDDGSKDGTRDALTNYLEKIRYIYQENSGEPSARNTGIRNATHEFIAFLDADDLWLEDKLDLQMNYFVEHPDCGLVYTDMKTFDDTGILEESVNYCRNLELPSGNVFARLFSETLFQTSSVVFRKSCVARSGFFDKTFFVGSDYDFWLRMARHFRFGYVDKPLVMYRQHAGMATRTLGKALSNGVPWEVKVLTKILNLYPDAVSELGETVIKRRLSQPYFNLAYGCIEEEDLARARRLLRQALTYWPTNLHYIGYYLASCLGPGPLSLIRGFYRWVSHSAESEDVTRNV